MPSRIDSASRSFQLNRARGCALIAEEIVQREHAVATGKANDVIGARGPKTYGRKEDRAAILAVADQYTALAAVWVAIADATGNEVDHG